MVLYVFQNIYFYFQIKSTTSIRNSLNQISEEMTRQQNVLLAEKGNCELIKGEYEKAKAYYDHKEKELQRQDAMRIAEHQMGSDLAYTITLGKEKKPKSKKKAIRKK